MSEPTIIPFDSFEEMQKHISASVERAKANIQPRQAKITYGDYWMRIWEDVLIFGHISTLKELEAEERRLGADDAEIAWERKVLENSYADGFRYGRAYSVIEPRGELGDTHVSVMYPITKEEFEQARAANWSPYEIVNFPWFMEVAERLD